MKYKYTLVQHSAYSANGDRRFVRATEEHPITDREADAVRRAGGLVFDTYKEARRMSLAETYPPDNRCLIGAVKGSFRICRDIDDNLRIYVPKKAAAQ